MQLHMLKRKLKNDGEIVRHVANINGYQLKMQRQISKELVRMLRSSR